MDSFNEDLADLSNAVTPANPGSESETGAEVRKTAEEPDSCFPRNDQQHLFQEPLMPHIIYCP
jgi:hypothetical protein